MSDFKPNETQLHYKKISDHAMGYVENLNQRLYEIAALLKQLQPMGNGSVILELTSCGVKGCGSCPHLRWRLYKPMKTENGSRYVGFEIKGSPLRRIKRTGEYKECAEKVYLLVNQALQIEKRRKSILEPLSSLNQRLKAKHAYDLSMYMPLPNKKGT